MKITAFKALTFDVYGTLIDWESGMIAGLKPLTDKLNPQLERDEILESHARHESATQAFSPARNYQGVLSVVYKRLSEEWGLNVT